MLLLTLRDLARAPPDVGRGYGHAGRNVVSGPAMRARCIRMGAKRPSVAVAKAATLIPRLAGQKHPGRLFNLNHLFHFLSLD